ncbi:MAG: DUF2791 family P-loop domain-containing protein [Spirochaetales bacterium]|jgi:hypothetical protein|nr:DUF2791 family P-loop domain-containing protein [Spirochaetales bacterium]
MNYEDTITALKSGTVPAKDASELCIGREKEIEEFKYLLKKTGEGKSITKFINGEYGSGKSFFLKLLEENALEDNYVVSKVTLSRDVPFNKFEIVYRNIVKSLRCKTGTSLEHIIEKWITHLKMMVFEQTDDPIKQNLIIRENMHSELESARKHSNPFVVAIENYYNAMNTGDYETAKYAQSWLGGDSNIPFKYKNKFGVKGEIDKENAFKFLKSLSAFIQTIGYSGLVILIDEVEHIMDLHSKKLRDTAYDYIRFIYDECTLNNFEYTLFVLAGTPEFFDDPKKGTPSYEALGDKVTGRIQNPLENSSYQNLRNPIMTLEGFNKDELTKIAEKIKIMHSEVFEWDSNTLINPNLIERIVTLHESHAAQLKGGKVSPRQFIRPFISVLDTVQQNPDELNSDEKIMALFEEKEIEEFEDDW